MTAEKLIGQNVVKKTGEDVGTIKGIVLNADDKAVRHFGLRISGSGRQRGAVPFEQLAPATIRYPVSSALRRLNVPDIVALDMPRMGGSRFNAMSLSPLIVCRAVLAAGSGRCRTTGGRNNRTRLSYLNIPIA